MKQFIFPVLIILIAFALTNKTTFAQGYPNPGIENSIPKEAQITGVITDGTSNQTIPYASVAVYKSKDSTLVTGVLSKDDGTFNAEKLPYGKYFLVVTFVGYKKHMVSDILMTPTKKIAALGAVKVNTTSTVLKTVEVVGNVAPVSYQIDKKVINIAQSITAAGGTLAEALQSAPSVKTDIEGNITLRGSSNFTVLIDGRPSPIAGNEALQQIPANLVQNVEIITNPGAKYEAEGNAGIVNVVMKKQKIQGSSGIFNLTGGTGNKSTVNASLNYKITKFNFTLGGDYTDNHSQFKNFTNSRSVLGTSPSWIKNQEVNGTGDMHRTGKGLNLGIDYTINDKNSITFTGSIGRRSFGRSISSFYHDTYNLGENTPTTVYFLDSSTPEFVKNYQSLNLDYVLKLDNNGQKITASAYFNGGPNKNNGALHVDTTNANGLSLNKELLEQNSLQKSQENDLRTKADYEIPIGKTGKFGAGYQGRYVNNEGEYHLQNYIGTSWIEDNSQQDKLNFKDQFHAGYVTLSNSMSLFNYQLGLRTEYEDRILNQQIQKKSYKVNRIDLFPTVHLTKQLPQKFQLQASYTRRTNRPQQWNINPFVVHIDPQSIRQGNPGLLPEFSNSFELNIEKKLSEASMLSFEGFMRQTDNLIEQVSKFDQPIQITTNTFDNIDHDRSVGAEFMANLELYKWFSVNSSVSLYNYQLFGSTLTPGISTSTNSWDLHINPTLRMGKKTTIQLMYMYNAPSITSQGTRSGYYFTSLGIKQSILKNKGTLSLQARNLIGNMSMNSTTQSPNQYRTGRFEHELKTVMLTFSYRINNYRTKQSGRGSDDSGGGSREQDIEGGGF